MTNGDGLQTAYAIRHLGAERLWDCCGGYGCCCCVKRGLFFVRLFAGSTWFDAGDVDKVQRSTLKQADCSAGVGCSSFAVELLWA